MNEVLEEIELNMRQELSRMREDPIFSEVKDWEEVSKVCCTSDLKRHLAEFRKLDSNI
jgi:hypothetical protein